MFWLLFVGFLTIFYLYVRKKMTYFADRGVPEDVGYFPIGSGTMWKMVTGRIAFSDMTHQLYEKFDTAKAVGYYGIFGRPYLVIRDLELAKKIMIKDFDHFTDRRNLAANPESNKYFNNMVSVLKGEKWKITRNIMTPIFTSGKMKALMPVMNDIGDDLVYYLDKLDDTSSINTKDMFSRYTIDILANTGCGVKANILREPENNYVFEQSSILTGGGKPNVMGMIRFTVLLLAPKLAYHLNFPVMDSVAMEFFANLIRTSIRSRIKEKVRKNDFIDLLADAIKDVEENQSFSTDQGESQFEKDAVMASKHKLKDMKFTEEEIETIIISQGIVMFFAGNDTSSSGLALATHFLAKHPDAQERLYKEIQDAINDNNGDEHLDYNVLHGLTYMGSFIKESLRFWGISFLERECTKDYYIPELNFTVPKGMLVQVAGSGIMGDKKYFNDADKFDPEGHFESDTIYPYSFLTFGQGPRNCIGMRFAYTILRSGLVRLVNNYKILPCPKTPEKLDIDPFSQSFLPKGGLHVKLVKRK